jgi:hypothetical protein
MQALTLFMIVAVTTFDFFAAGDKWGRWAYLPSWSAYLAELTGIAAAAVVIFAGARNGFRYVRPAYWLMFGFLVLVILSGAITNAVNAGPIFAGIRAYLRAIPWFLLPAVFAFTDSQVKTQLRLLVAIAVIQLPFAVQQASTAISLGKITGDWTVGTLMLSPTLSIFLICCICIAAAFAARRQLKPWHFIVLALIFLIPTTINETKATFFLLPIGLFVTFMVASRAGQRARYGALALISIGVSTAIFVPIYDSFIAEREYAVPLMDFISDPERMKRYLSTTDDIGVVGKDVGRLDSIVVPWRRLSADPAQLAFGYGIGNVSHSALGHGFVGRHFQAFGAFADFTFSRLLLELGVLGLFGVLALLWMIFRDSHVVSQRGDGVISTLAAGWAGVVAVITLSTLYSEVIAPTSLSYLFWYLSGLIAAARMRPSTQGIRSNSGV